MAITVVPETSSPGKEFGKSLATGLGGVAAKGIGAGLGALGTGLGQVTGLIEKPKKLTEDMLIKAGFTPEDARLIVNSPPALQAKLIDAISQRQDTHQAYQGTPSANPAQEQPQEMQGEGEPSGNELKVHPAVQQAFDEVSAERSNKQETRPSALFRPKKETPEQARLRLAEEKLGFQKEEATKKHKSDLTKEERIEQRHIDQETKSFYDKVKDKRASEEENYKNITRMNKLIDTGELIGPVGAAVFSALEKGIFGHGINLWGLTSADTQTFKKIEAGFVKGAKALFGSRVTEKEIEFFMATVPSLLNSDEGKRQISELYKAAADAASAEDRSMEEIIAENGGRRPRNLRKLTEERSKSLFEDAAGRFESIIQSSNPKQKKSVQSQNSAVPAGATPVDNPKTGERGYLDKNGIFTAL